MPDDRLSHLFKSLRADEDPNPAFGESLFNQLQDEVAAPRRSRQTWVLLAAALLVASIAAGAAFGSGVLRIPWLIADASVTPQPVASATPTIAPSEVPTTPSPSATPSELVGTVVRITPSNVSLRAEPGLDGEPMGALRGDGTPAFVVAGPVAADGYEWYQLAALGIPPNSGCMVPPVEALDDCPNWFGWVAGGDEGGEPWLEPAPLDCPESPMNMLDLAVARGAVERLACGMDGSITVRGWWPELPDDGGLGGACASGPPSGWLYCQNINYNLVVVDENEGADGGVGLKVSIDPESGVMMRERGQWIEIVGHFDDPGANGCAENAVLNGDIDQDPDLIVLICRTHLVVDSVEPVSGPF